jgi:hypothetical protein
VPVVVLAVDLFNDVPPSNVFYNDINAIALAGITTGCGGGAYCPDAYVTRGQMAAFMHRGFSRVAKNGWSSTIMPASEVSVASVSITPALPTGTLPGAQGFIKADATVTIVLGNATGCPCTVRGALYSTGQSYLTPFYSDLTFTTLGETKVMAMTGAIAVPDGAAKTVEVRLFRLTGASTSWTHFGNVTALYVPFGSGGTNFLGPQIQPGSGLESTMTPQSTALSN